MLNHAIIIRVVPIYHHQILLGIPLEEQVGDPQHHSVVIEGDIADCAGGISHDRIINVRGGVELWHVCGMCGNDWSICNIEQGHTSL